MFFYKFPDTNLLNSFYELPKYIKPMSRVEYFFPSVIFSSKHGLGVFSSVTIVEVGVI